MEPAEALHRLGGLASFGELNALCSRSEIAAATDADAIVRGARGRYALPQVDVSRRLSHALNGVVSHTSAALLWGWGIKQPSPEPHITFPRRRVVTPETRRLCLPHWADLGPDDVTDRVTSRERTLADCLRSLPPDEALCVADSALRDGLAPSNLRAIAHGLRGAGAGQARRIAALADGRAANPFESCLRAIALDVPGLTPQPQVPLTVGGTYVRPDLVDVDLGIILEADSHEWHNNNRRQLLHDCRRYTAMVVAGWLVVRFAWEDVMSRQDDIRLQLVKLVELAATRAEVLGPLSRHA
ncbi:MAG TPA: hypothetical protein VF426_08840 [Marmoricola sp.]